jgi:hypothetical protein
MYAQSETRCRATSRPVAATTQLIASDAPRRAEAEQFIRSVFARRYAAQVSSFAPDLMLLEHADIRARNGVIAAAGWRGAGSTALFLEAYLDQPVQTHLERLAGQPVARPRIAEVGNLASVTPGGGARMILALAEHLDRIGFEWVVFTATQELIGIFAKLGLPPLALEAADPRRLGDAAREWGRYYDSRPVVVAGRIRLALDRLRPQSETQRA